LHPNKHATWLGEEVPRMRSSHISALGHSWHRPFLLRILGINVLFSVVFGRANPWGDIFESCFKAQSSKLERLFSLKRGKRDVRALSSEL